MAEIARRLGLPHATIRNYFQGRLPSPEVLIKIAAETNVSLNWLLAGDGEMFPAGKRPVDLDRMLEEKIAKTLDRLLSERGLSGVRDIGAIDLPPQFDAAAAVTLSDDPHAIMSDWFKHEGREYPADFGVVFFQGWSSFSASEKLDAVRDAKKVLDRTLRSNPIK